RGRHVRAVRASWRQRQPPTTRVGRPPGRCAYSAVSAWSSWTPPVLACEGPRSSSPRARPSWPEQLLRGQAAQGGIQYAGGVGRRERHPGTFQGRGDLQRAPGVARDQDLRAGGGHVLPLAVTEFGGGLRFEQVVHTRRTTTDLLVRRVGELQLGNRTEQSARGTGDLLAVGQMTGGVVGDVQR